MSLIIPANTLASGGFSVDNSVRLDGSSSYMTKSMGTPTNADKYTFSFWVKRSKLGAQQSIFRSTDSGTNDSHVTFQADDTLRFEEYGGQASIGKLQTTQVFRDISAWYSILLVYDSGNGTAGNRMRMYVNGTEVTAFGTDNNPSQNADSFFNKSGETLSFGRTPYSGGGNYFSGYVAELVMCDGQTLTPTDIGEFDEDSGIFKPINVSGLTFGTNGFYLDFEDSANLGNDANGGTDFTESGLAAIDQSTDTCTNNFITMNPLDSYYSASTFSEGNLKIVSSSGNYSPDMGTIGLSAGKWYWEVKIDTTSTEDMIGITGNQRLSSGSSTSHLGGMLYDFAYNSYAKFYNNNGNVSYGATFGNNDIIGVALDLDSGTNTIQFYKNGSAQGSKNITHVSSTENGFYHVSAGDFTSGASMTFSSNFGSPSYSESGGETDGNGYGNFANAVPSGYYALNTKNLAEYG